MAGSISTRPCKRKRRPAAVSLFPVHRRGPPLCLHYIPAQRQPEFGAGVAAVFDECKKIAVGYRMRCELEWGEEDVVPRLFIIEAEAGAVVANGDHSAGEANPPRRARFDRGQRPTVHVRGLQRVA